MSFSLAFETTACFQDASRQNENRKSWGLGHIAKQYGQTGTRDKVAQTESERAHTQTHTKADTECDVVISVHVILSFHPQYKIILLSLIFMVRFRNKAIAKPLPAES